MDKQRIKDQLLSKFQLDLSKAKESLNTTQDFLKSDDLAQESKYDTRSIEAGYLADGQRKRIEEIEQDIQLIQDITTDLCHSVAIGSLVLLEINKIQKWYYYSPTSGGTILTIDGHPVVVISVFSPIGAQSVGLAEKDSFEVEHNNDVREYIIRKIE
ncbi:MAG: hypothetical protein H6622_11790 [Halobacteriovoraceae bacterium]|nr:hypothetical protein [Halobacteriovoraceae bacterium]